MYTTHADYRRCGLRTGTGVCFADAIQLYQRGSGRQLPVVQQCLSVRHRSIRPTAFWSASSSDPNYPQIPRAPPIRRFLSNGWDTANLNQRVVNSHFASVMKEPMYLNPNCLLPLLLLLSRQHRLEFVHHSGLAQRSSYSRRCRFGDRFHGMLRAFRHGPVLCRSGCLRGGRQRR